MGTPDRPDRTLGDAQDGAVMFMVSAPATHHSYRRLLITELRWICDGLTGVMERLVKTYKGGSACRYERGLGDA